MTRIRTGLLTMAVVAGVLSTGCGVGTSAPAGQHAVPATTSLSKRTTTTTTAPPTTTTVAVTAADGTNLGACANGNCEVQVASGASIPLSGSLGVGPVAVTGIQPDTVSISITVTASQVSDNCTGDPSCLSNLSANVVTGSAAVAQTTGHVGANLIVNQLTVTVAAVGPGSAILRLSTS
jgi:hypothetical protein